MDSGHRFNELADSTPVLIWRSGPDKLYDYLNVTWLRFRGRSLDDEKGYGWLEGVHPDDVERCVALYVAAFDSRQDFTIDFRLQRSDGEYRWMLGSGHPYIRSDGTLGGFLGSSVHITDRKEAEMRATRALADARRAIMQRDVLLAEVHHRVKNNLQVILSLLTLQARHLSDERGRQALDSVARRIQALAFVQQELHEDPDVAMIGILDYVSRIVRPLCALYRLEPVETGIEGDNLPIGITVASIVGMIVSEIVGNAFQHGVQAGGDGWVRLHVRRESDGRPTLTIEDSGRGFDPNRETQGLGLRLIRKLSRQGGISASLEPGPGARWILTLPASGLTPGEGTNGRG